MTSAGRKPSPKQPGANKARTFPFSPALAFGVLSEEGKESEWGGGPPCTLCSQTPHTQPWGVGRSLIDSHSTQRVCFSASLFFTRCV